MPTFDDANVVHGYLEDLADALELDDAEAVDMLVCGGAALAVAGLVTRATGDIDVLALVVDGEDVAAKPFPERLEKAVHQVAQTRDLPDKWLNPGPADMQQFGLPDGIVDRAEVKTYGDRLTVRFLDRYDQIHLKLYASVDNFGGKHLADLKKLDPDDGEIVNAAKWCMKHDPSDGFRQALEWLLENEGFTDALEDLSK